MINQLLASLIPPIMVNRQLMTSANCSSRNNHEAIAEKRAAMDDCVVIMRLWKSMSLPSNGANMRPIPFKRQKF